MNHGGVCVTAPATPGLLKRYMKKRLNVKKDNMRQNMSKAKAISAKLLELNLKIPFYSPVFCFMNDE